jgi:hypothetical protein
MFSSNKKRAKQKIENTIISLESIFNKTIGNYLIRMFFDAKADEIVNMYTGGPVTSNKNRLIQVVKKLSPNNSAKWNNIR